jgi:hypothetical protein
VTDEKRVGIIAVHHSRTPLAAITEISKDARLGANNMPAIEKAVILTCPQGWVLRKAFTYKSKCQGYGNSASTAVRPCTP